MIDRGADRPREDRIWTLRLLGLPDPRRDLALTLAAVAVLAASRFLLLADGPWEQDEAIFARSILDFAPRQHFPHPPFFPGWIGLGFLVTPLAGEPLLALQLLSAVSSVLALWPLAFLGRRVAPPAVAAACAFGVGFLPGAWVFAVRGFSCTAAALLALLAAAMLHRDIAGRRFLGFSALVAAAFLVRPVLAPLLLVLWLAGAWGVRPRRLALAGAGTGIAMALAGFAPFVAATGGLGGFLKVFSSHAEEHFGAVGDYAVTLANLGIVSSFGGIAATAAAAVLAVAGVVAWGRSRGWRAAAVYAALVVALVLSLLFAHVPTFPRYSVPLLLAVAPLAAGALAWLPAAAGAGVALAAAAWSAAVWMPVVVEQHTTRFPMWAAAVEGCEAARAATAPTRVLAGRGGWAFVSYYDRLLRSRGVGGDAAQPENWTSRWKGPVAAPHWVVVTSSWESVLPWQRTRELARHSGVSAKAERLSQHRFLTGVVVADLPLQRGSWWAQEKDGSGRAFSWCSSPASLVLPAAEPLEPWVLTVRAARGEAPLTVGVNRKTSFTVPGTGAVASLRVPSDALFADRENTVTFERAATYPPNERDRRPLAAAVYVATSGKVEGATVGLGDADGLRALGITLRGFHGRETFRDGVVGRWTQPTAVIEMPAVAGRFELTLLAPRPAEARAEVWLGGTLVGGPWVVPTVPRSYEFAVPPDLATGPTMAVELRVTPYATPALPKRPSRTLGVVVSRMTIPEGTAAR